MAYQIDVTDPENSVLVGELKVYKGVVFKGEDGKTGFSGVPIGDVGSVIGAYWLCENLPDEYVGRKAVLLTSGKRRTLLIDIDNIEL